jgi:hypothetical protein
MLPALLGFMLIAMALFALGVWYAVVLAADLSRLAILLTAIVLKVARSPPISTSTERREK